VLIVPPLLVQRAGRIPRSSPWGPIAPVLQWHPRTSGATASQSFPLGNLG
jgi:hypothetical protein